VAAAEPVDKQEELQEDDGAAAVDDADAPKEPALAKGEAAEKTPSAEAAENVAEPSDDADDEETKPVPTKEVVDDDWGAE
jgi:hypothetical protein